MLLSILVFACAPKSAPPVEPAQTAPAPAPEAVEQAPVATPAMVMTPAAEVGWFPMNPDAPDFGQLAMAASPGSTPTATPTRRSCSEEPPSPPTSPGRR